ncbi:MAG: RnfABCDGE type electron transport complex subunit G [Gammaproteobacteria bacterium]|nr:RnfABCDGE type electron transport complex subunit G [Gammaproteobacteria bacterium]
MKPWVNSSLTLMLASLVMLSAVSVIEQITSESIKLSRQHYKQSLFKTLLNNLSYDSIIKLELKNSLPRTIGSDVMIHEVQSVQLDTHRIATLIEASTNRGYNGEIRALLAIGQNDDVIGIQILKHQETPGLGDNIDNRRSNWLQQFYGQSLGKTPENNWKVYKDGGQFDQLTGATITPRAVVKLFLVALKFHKQNCIKDIILQ